MKNSEMLRNARVLVESGKQRFVCCAVTKGTPNEYTSELRGWVLNMIRPHFTLESWIEDQPGVCEIVDEAYEDLEKMRVTRLAWIDWMITYWEGKGQ